MEAAIGIADRQGLAAASMRAIASKLDNSTMSSYYHVRDRSELLVLMAETALAEALPCDETPEGLRVETVARALWDVYRRHPWLSQIEVDRLSRSSVALTQAEWVMRALLRHGLDRTTSVRYSLLLRSFIRGVAGQLQAGAGQEMSHLVPGADGAGERIEADEVFELGLRALLNGIEQPEVDGYRDRFGE
ncbi:TetR/AcrR family transcriptional regulator [Amycolatopsis sp. lyj-90]|uniref:TetR/AcrR family transcriptional regulator n=1 Tax=Amycolatopsis sp. lyj-90 TaxID=2789285 RepID=UPI00397C80DC